jgi:membrane dipeptidase
MFVDISHVAHSTMHAVLDNTFASILFSHTLANALCPIERNVPDPFFVDLRKQQRGFVYSQL